MSALLEFSPTSFPPSYQEILGRTAHLLLQDSDPDTLCQSLFEMIRRPLGLDVYFHFLVTPDRSHLELASSGGNDFVRAALGTPIQFGETVCGTVAKNCQSMHVPDVQRRSDETTSLIRTFGIRCYTCYPIVVKEQLIGTLSFGSSTREAFRNDELEVLRLVSQQVTLATERRVQNDHLREMERLAAAGRMSVTLAHEINNPLDSLSTILYLLRNEVRSSEGEQLLKNAEEQVKMLTDVSHRTLELFRGNQQQPRPVNVSQIANELVADIHLPQHAKLRTEIEDDLCVNAVAGELRQVLFNILINAAQFTPPGKEVVLTVRGVSGYAEVRVKDLGPGIPESARAHLFKPFYTTRGAKGTGVGLWISRQIMERFGGTLTFESDPTTHPGTEFIARLPLVN